jgi:MFS transporter, DHA1 family, tetracycline resistance protein
VPSTSTDDAENLRTSRFASPLLPIFLIVLVDVLGFTIILPLLPFYSERLGATPTVVGALVAIYAVCQLIAGPILGQMSDRVGRRPILLVSQAGTLLGFLLLAFSTQLWMVFLARAIDGATAGNLTIAQAYISDVTKPENRAKSFALIGIAFGFGFTVGPAIAGYLARFGYQAPIFAACALSFTTILCTYFLLPRREVVHQYNEAEGAVGPGGKRLSLISWGEYRKYFKNRELSRLLKQWLLFSLSFATFISGFALFAERTYTWKGRPFGPAQVGYVFAFNGLLGIVMQGGVVGRMVKWMGERNVVRLGFFLTALVYTGIGFTSSVWPLLVLMLVGALASALRPALTSLITQNAGKREQGVIIGLTQSLMSIAQITAPLIGGALIGRADMHPPGAPENHLFLTIWGVWGGLLAGLALLFELTPSDSTPAEPLSVPEASHA